MPETPSAVRPHYQHLPWDTAHYGLAVGRIDGDPRDAYALAKALDQARSAGARLVYFLHEQAFNLDEDLLHRYGGRRVGGYVRFSRPLPLPSAEAPAPCQGPSLEVFAGPADDPHVLALGVGAGWLSRFRADTRLPAEKCDELYTIWTRRSILGELADETLVARLDEIPVGLVTYRARPECCEIGLVGIAPAARGRGIGKALMAFSHGRMTARGHQRSDVVTQTENEGACRLYRGAGYAPVKQGAYYHFLLAEPPLAGEPSWTSR
jgi:GNAT superfamily N-acetyltransferase